MSGNTLKFGTSSSVYLSLDKASLQIYCLGLAVLDRVASATESMLHPIGSIFGLCWLPGASDILTVQGLLSISTQVSLHYHYVWYAPGLFS